MRTAIKLLLVGLLMASVIWAVEHREADGVRYRSTAAAANGH